MPELPEVQTTVDGLRQYVIGAKILDIWTDYPKRKVNRPDFEGTIKSEKFWRDTFLPKVKGARILQSERRAKNILIHLSNSHTILIHLKMTGHLLHGKYNHHPKHKDKWRPADSDGPLADPFNRFIRLIFSLDTGKHLALSDTRRFAKVTLIKTDTLHQSKHLSDIGPEPLESSFTLTKFAQIFSNKRYANRPIKPTLMDQTVLAGIGNIYADESLWRAGIDPRSKVGKIPRVKISKLHSAIRQTLRKGIDFGGDSMSDYRDIEGKRGKFQEQHGAYQMTGKRCKKCPGTIKRIVLAGRSTHFCPKHQVKY